MSITVLPREQGMWIKCNGTQEAPDETTCDEKVYSGLISAKKNRAWFLSKGWGRGLRKGYKRRDLCPKCMTVERLLLKKQKADWEAEKARRDEVRKAKRSGAVFSKAPATKKSRKPTSTADASPSADSVPAPA